MNKRKKIFIKISALLCVVALAFTFVMVKPKASTITDDGNVYSDNGLNLIGPDINFKYTVSATDNFAPTIETPFESLDTLWIGGTSYPWSRFTIRIYNSSTLSGSSYVRTVANITTFYQFGTVDLGFGNGISSQSLRNDTTDYYLVFMSEVNVNGSNQGSAIGYRFSRILDYFDMFSDSTTNYTYWYLTYRLDSYNVGLPNTLRVSHLGVYRGSSMSVTESTYSPNYTWLFNDSQNINQQSFNQGVISQKPTIDELRKQIFALTLANNTLQNDLATAQDTQMRSLIWTIGSTPFESFKTIWNVNIWGINIGGIILGGLMALLVLYLIKKIWK